jgi:RibD C-terminal domain
LNVRQATDRGPQRTGDFPSRTNEFRAGAGALSEAARRHAANRPDEKENVVMRKVILYVNATIDGHLAGPHGELDWMLPDPVMNQQLSDALRAGVDTILTGRNAYHGFEEHFRRQAADPASPPGLVDFANWMIDTPKIVFSRTLSTVSAPARLATADIPDEVASLKRSRASTWCSPSSRNGTGSRPCCHIC